MFCFSAFQEETMCIEVDDFQFEIPYKERHKVHIVKSRKSHTRPGDQSGIFAKYLLQRMPYCVLALLCVGF